MQQKKKIEKELVKAYNLVSKYCLVNDKTKKLKSSIVDTFILLRDIEPYNFERNGK